MTTGLNSQFAAGIVDQVGAERAHAIRVSPLFHRVRAIA